MHILQICNRIPYPLNDGGNIATYYLTHHLEALHHQVYLLALNTKKHYQNVEQLPPLATNFEAIDIAANISKSGAFKALLQQENYLVQRFYSEKMLEKILYVIKHNKFEIIQLESVYLSVYLSEIKQHSNIPLVLRAHNIEHKIWERTASTTSNFLLKTYLKILSRQIKTFEQQAFAQYNAVITLTEVDANYVRQNTAPQKVYAIPPGVNKFVPPLNPPVTNKIGFLGSLEWLPNRDGLQWFVQEVMPKVWQKLPNLEFHIAGKNPPADFNFKEYPQIVFHGEINDIDAYYCNFSLMVVPLLSGSGLRIKILEAFAQGKCVVSTSVGAEGIAASDKEHFFLADSADDFANNIISLLSDKQLMMQTCYHASQWIEENYKWENLAKKIENVYKSLV
ncbi:MAG: glycosyltransferase family 4 protein [Chitinophagales bacterium]|nr:glycosyltransferase [Bacteroidota bacterium]MCB9044479.1 glycosyltransferase [Chitinophagales bacterium]